MPFLRVSTYRTSQFLISFHNVDDDGPEVSNVGTYHISSRGTCLCRILAFWSSYLPTCFSSFIIEFYTYERPFFRYFHPQLTVWLGYLSSATVKSRVSHQKVGLAKLRLARGERSLGALVPALATFSSNAVLHQQECVCVCMWYRECVSTVLWTLCYLLTMEVMVIKIANSSMVISTGSKARQTFSNRIGGAKAWWYVTAVWIFRQTFAFHLAKATWPKHDLDEKKFMPVLADGG